MSDLNDFNRAIIEEFRANDGKVGGPFARASMVLLTTTGAKSGRRITTPLVYQQDGDSLVIIASKAGAPTHPAWYHNLLANPVVRLEVGSEMFEARATVAGEVERTRLYQQAVEAMPQFAEYQRNTTRLIPVVVLKRLR